jgi:hypothetical protein
MQWTITRVAKDMDLEAEVGTVGPSTATLTAAEIAKAGQAFRMADDDGQVIYHGRAIGGPSFAPLDGWGTPNFGCTRIDWYEDGRWQTL